MTTDSEWRIRVWATSPTNQDATWVMVVRLNDEGEQQYATLDYGGIEWTPYREFDIIRAFYVIPGLQVSKTELTAEEFELLARIGAKVYSHA